MPGYSDQIYNYILKLDPTYKNDVSLQAFKSKMANPTYSRQIYDWIGSADATFKSDVSFDAFSSQMGYPKKKVTTASPGSGAAKPSSSGPLSKAVNAGVQKVVAAAIKPEGSYKYPGREDALYKKTNNQWYIDLGKTGKYVKINEKNRIDALEKYAKTYTPDIVKSATQVVKDIGKGATELISKTTPPTAAELQKDVKKEIDYLESQKQLSNKEIADIFGWNESDVERVASSSSKSTTPITKAMAANAIPVVKTNTSQPSIEQFSQNVQKVMNDLGENASEEKKQERLEYYNTKDLQTYLKGEGYDVDVNGDKEDDKTQKALKHSNMKEQMFIEDMYESMDQYDRVYGLVNENMLEMSEEEAVPLLRKYFGKDGFTFNETGIGNYVEVVSPGKKKQVFEFNTSDPESISKLREFLGNTYLAKNEKKKYNDLLNGDDVDMNDPRARDKYFYDLTTLIGQNPDKYADVLGDPDDILSGTHPIKSAIDRTAYNIKAESIQLNKDYAALKTRIDKYNANPEKYGNQERAAINNILHDLKVREYNILKDQKKITSMDNSLRRITGKKIIESRKSGDWAGVLTSQFFKGITAIPLLSTQLAMDALPYAVGAENFFDPITYDRLKTIDGYNDLEIQDLGVKKLKQTIYGDIERGISNVASFGTTTPEYVSDPERNDILKGVSFMAESVGTAMAGGGSGTLQKLGFFAMSYNGMEKEMMDPRFDDMSETEKKLYSVPYGFVIGALERFGYNALSGGDKSIVNRLASGVIGRTLAGLPKDATISTIKREINKNVGRMVADGVINVAGGAVAEGSTEALQRVFEVGEKYAINQIKDKEYFQGIPDITTWEGIKKTYDLAKEDFYYAAIGSLVFSSGVNSVQTMQQYRFNKKTDAEFDVLYNSVSNPFLRNMTELDIKSRLAKGEMTKEEAASQIQALKDVAGRLSRVNPNLSLRDKKDSFNLILEKEKLEKEKAPLDEALQAPYNERIAEINNELKTIAQNAFQEQTTSEVPVQPEAAVSGEMAQGVPQAEPQVTTQEGGQAVQEEVRPIEEATAKAQEEVESYIVDRFRNLKLEPVIDPLLNKMNNAEYIDDADIDNALEIIFKELDDIDNSEYSDNVKTNVKDSLLNLAEKLDNYEFRTKDKTVTVAQKRAADSTRENVQKVKVEEFFSGAKAIHNGEEVEFDTTKGVVEAKLPNGNTIVFDTPSMEVKEDGIVIGDDGNLSTVTMVDRFGSEFTFDGDIALDLAIKDRQNKIGEIPPPVFDIVMEEMTVKEPYIKERTVQPQPTVEPTVETEVTPVAEAQPTIEAQPTEAQPVETQPVATEEEVDQELEALRTLLQGTDEQIDEQVSGLDISNRNDKVAENIANAAKTISRILPNVEFIVHDTEESYRQATGNNARGTYIPEEGDTKPQIHINSKKANNRTAAHEVFHAVLLNAVKSNEEAQRLTKSMINAVMKSMSNIEGQQGLKKYLYDFADNYEYNVRDEEKLAELLGVLATNYKNLEAPSKNIIKRFFERIAKLIGLKPMTDREVVDFMNTMADALYKGEVLTKRDIAMLPKPRKKSISNIIKRFQSDFSDAFSKLSFVYDKNGEEFNKLEKQGYITKDKSLSDFNGKYMFLHQPDAAFSGMIYKDGEILVEGKGGVFYPIKFHKDGYFWASTDKTASKMAEDLNKVFEQNGGVIYMALTSAPYDKLLSSTTMSNAVLDFFSSKAFDKNFKITENQFKVALRNAANNFVIKTVKNDDGKVVSKKVGLQLNLPGNTTIAEMKSAIKEKLNPDNSSFADRKEFVLELIKLMAAQINKNDVSIEQFGKLFSQGIQNKYFKGITKTGKVSISAANMRQALSEMLTEPILKEDIERSKGGQVYAVLELTGKVKGVDSDKHESYPKAIQSEDANNKVTLHILKDRLKWSDVFEDFETNKIVAKDRYLKVYPTSGVSVRGLKLNTGKITPRQQQPGQNINQIVTTARNNNFSDATIEKLLKQQGYTDAEIQSALTAPRTTLGIDEIFNRSNQALQRQYDTPAYKRALRYANKMIFERQEAIKRLMRGIKNKDASRAYNMLINKAGATGFASTRFKEADRKIYGRLGGKTPIQRKENRDDLDKMIYLRRFIAINENLRKKGEEPYIGMGGFNEEKAREGLQKIKERIGEKKFEKFSKRADIYFNEYKENLKMLYESGRINKETYENFKDIEYSPIKVIKYIIDDNADPSEVDTQAAKLGINRKDIMKLGKLNENAIVFDSRWLLMLNIHTVAARAFENDMLSSFAKAIDEGTEEEREAVDPYIKANPTIGSKQDGTPKQKYNMMNTPVGYTAVSYFDNGIQKTLVVKDEYAQQLLDIKNLDSSLRFLSAMTLGNVLRYFATVGNPLFIIGNVPVDIVNAAFFTDVYSPFKPLAVLQASTGFSYRFLQGIAYDVAPLYEGIRRIFNKDYDKERRNKFLYEFVSHGGTVDTLHRQGLRPLERNMFLTGTKKAINDTLLNTGRATSYLGSKSEIAMRLAVYAKRKRNLIAEFKKENNGESPQGQELDDIMWEAAREGRELIDFSQGGEFIKKADQVIPYLNAAVQGLRKQGRFAVENKILFASNVLQGMGMFAGIAAYSLANAYAAASDEEEDKDKQNQMVIDTLDSISEHEKSQYHIIFTGKKKKENGKTILQYVRIKKLPFFSIATTYAEQFAMRYWINKNGGKYDIDNKLIKLVMEKSMPLLPSEVASRNPMVAALVAYNFNYDFFTKKEVFRNKEKLNINPIYEGIEDDKVEDFFKVIAPALGMSPKRTKAAVEKIITSPSTNPLVHVLYGAMNGIFSDKTELSEDVKVAGDMILESAEKKMVRYTDPEILRYVREDRDKEEQMRIRSEIYQREQKVNKIIKDKLEKNEKYTSQELMKIVEENFPKYDREKYFKKYKTRMMFPDLDKQVLDIVYEETPEIQAQKLWSKYGNSLEEDEKSELIKVMRSINKKISPKVFRIYNEKYKNR